METAKAADIFGSMPGHTIEQCDARQAYIQADLDNGVPTYVRLPPEFWPDGKGWEKMKDPVVPLKKALYGHPEAGGHWERHLIRIIVTPGGKPVKNHPSVFRFNDKSLLLIVYVDDLLLSGPAEHHSWFWDSLRSKVLIEDPEDIDRYLGHHHEFKEFSPLKFNLMDFFKSPHDV